MNKGGDGIYVFNDAVTVSVCYRMLRWWMMNWRASRRKRLCPIVKYHLGGTEGTLEGSQ